ncbi:MULTISPECIES: RNase A-like domain-containing protein [unclassified Curtobacterium]|uniref:RNase A-like domain-containing protein n=1 Tax=unclassified Curtobacterium TaxID=257496 RepID=UPI0037F1CC12
MLHAVRTGTSVFTGGTDDANRIVAHALDANHLRIRTWVADDCPKPLRVYAVPGGVTGRGMPFGEVQDLDAVRVVLTAAPDRPAGYTVLTAYPAVASITAANFAASDDFVGAYFHQDWADAPYGAADALEHYLAISSDDGQPGRIPPMHEDSVVRAVLKYDPDRQPPYIVLTSFPRAGIR